jgi:type I restriction enzyme S subunit
MKFKPYPKYVDSGVEWLGEIPEGWNLKRLRFCASLNPSKVEIQQVPASVSFLPMDCIGDDGSLDLSIVRSWEEIQQGYTFFQDGDVVYAIITPCFENGKGAFLQGLINGMGFGTTELTVLRPNNTCDGQWLWYLTVSRPFREIGKSYMYGAGGQKRVPDDFARNFPVSFPPLSTQRIIAFFLDSTTARIDSLVHEYEEVIALLQEKRQALISHAVTRGLSELVRPDDPDFGEWAQPVKFMGSGVEWLGEIPEGWEVAQSRRVIFGIEQGWSPQAEDAEPNGTDYSVLKLSAVKDGIYQESERKTLPKDTVIPAELLLKKGDILLTRANTPELVGDVCIIDHSDGRTIFSDLIYRISLDPTKCTPMYYTYFMRSLFARGQIFMNAKGSNISMIKLPQSAVLSIIIVYPILAVQQAISQFLSRETRKIDALIKETQDAIELLKEHRSALITNAVTGKIVVEDPILPHGAAQC